MPFNLQKHNSYAKSSIYKTASEVDIWVENILEDPNMFYNCPLHLKNNYKIKQAFEFSNRKIKDYTVEESANLINQYWPKGRIAEIEEEFSKYENDKHSLQLLKEKTLFQAKTRAVIYLTKLRILNTFLRDYALYGDMLLDDEIFGYIKDWIVGYAITGEKRFFDTLIAKFSHKIDKVIKEEMLNNSLDQAFREAENCLTQDDIEGIVNMKTIYKNKLDSFFHKTIDIAKHKAYVYLDMATKNDEWVVKFENLYLLYGSKILTDVIWDKFAPEYPNLFDNLKRNNPHSVNNLGETVNKDNSSTRTLNMNDDFIND